MKKKILIIIAVIMSVALIGAGCSKGEDASYDMVESNTSAQKMSSGDGAFGVADDYAISSEEAPAGVPSMDTGTNVSQVEDMSEKIIYNVYADLIADDVLVAVNSIAAKVKSLGGYVSYSNTYTSGGYKYANIEIRVPADKLDEMETYSDGLGEIENHTMSTQNVTESYYDIVARLEHQEAEEARLLDFLDKAETIEEMLLVRNELSRVQEQIESYKGRIRVWDSLVDYSTISYNISPTPTLNTNKDDGPRLVALSETWEAMKRGFKNTGIHVLNFFSWVLRTIVILAVPLVIMGVVALVVILIVRKNRTKDNK